MGRSVVSDKELTGRQIGASRAERMRAALNAAFSPAVLEIIDDSAKHAGHAGHRPEGETHYTVRMQAEAFVGLSRVERQRAVNRALADEFATGLHALSLELTPGA
jgi:BolA family transcriptional regulator, general stress-responsive regulator